MKQVPFVAVFAVYIHRCYRQRVPPGPGPGTQPVSDPMSESLKRLNGSQFEASFLDQMI